MRALLLPAHNASPWTGPTGNNTYLFTGAVPTLVDAGVGHADHLAAIAAALDGHPLAQVVVTHGHSDHVTGADAVRACWPGVRILKRLPSIGSGQLPLDDGQSIAAGDTRLEVVATPGHSPDHACFVDSGAREAYCGDLVRAGGTIVIAASKGGNLRQYLDSLERIRSLDARALLPGHGPAIDQPASLIDTYVLHRNQREKQVIAALHDGLSTADAIGARIYADIEPALHGAAVDTVLAHLIKLEEEGRARRSGERWWLTNQRSPPV